MNSTNNDELGLIEHYDKAGIVLQIISDVQVLQIGIEETGDWIVEEETECSENNEPVVEC